MKKEMNDYLMKCYADGGFVEDDPKLMDGLTSGSSTQALLSPPQMPDEEEPKTDQEKETESKVQDSHPGHTAEDLSLSDFIKGQESQASKYGPEQEKAVLDQILKERGGLGRNLTRAAAAFTDTAGPAFGAGTGMLKNLDEKEAETEKARLESVPTLQGMNEKQMAQKMALEGMNPNSALAQSKAGTLQIIMKKLFPDMSDDQLTKLTQNPSVMEKLFPDLGSLLEKQNMSDLKKMEIEQMGKRNQAEAANQGAERKQGALKELSNMGVSGKLIHPDIAKALEQQAGLQNGTTSYSPDVLSYAQKHGITPDQANQIKMKRMGR